MVFISRWQGWWGHGPNGQGIRAWKFAIALSIVTTFWVHWSRPHLCSPWLTSCCMKSDWAKESCDGSLLISWCIIVLGSHPGHNKEVKIDRAIAICRARRPRPRPHGPRPHHPCHWQIKAIISHYRRWFRCFGDLSILNRPILEIFRRKKMIIHLTRESHMCRKPDSLVFFLSYLLSNT